MKTYRDYHEVLARPDIDAVIVTPPDHWHAMVAVEAVLAGKDVYVQKPLTYDIAEAIALRTAVRARGRILQTGSQQRSAKPWNTFRIATEAVRNGRIGQVKVVRIGIGQDQPKGAPPQAAAGAAEPRLRDLAGPGAAAALHGRPRASAERPRAPGLDHHRRLRPRHDHQLGLPPRGHRALGHGDGAVGGPTSVEATATFMTGDVWTVHHTYHVEMTYPNGVLMIMDKHLPERHPLRGDRGLGVLRKGIGDR